MTGGTALNVPSTRPLQHARARKIRVYGKERLRAQVPDGGIIRKEGLEVRDTDRNRLWQLANLRLAAHMGLGFSQPTVAIPFISGPMRLEVYLVTSTGLPFDAPKIGTSRCCVPCGQEHCFAARLSCTVAINAAGAFVQQHRSIPREHREHGERHRACSVRLSAFDAIEPFLSAYSTLLLPACPLITPEAEHPPSTAIRLACATISRTVINHGRLLDTLSTFMRPPPLPAAMY